MEKQAFCKDCKWWNDIDEPDAPRNEDSGECRRRSPLHVRGDFDKGLEAVCEEDGAWPFTGALDWCGEFEAKVSTSGVAWCPSP